MSIVIHTRRLRTQSVEQNTLKLQIQIKIYKKNNIELHLYRILSIHSLSSVVVECTDCTCLLKICHHRIIHSFIHQITSESVSREETNRKKSLTTMLIYQSKKKILKKKSGGKFPSKKRKKKSNKSQSHQITQNFVCFFSFF